MKIFGTTGREPGRDIQRFDYTHGDIVEQFKNAMLDRIGYAPETIIGDGHLHRVKDESGKLNGAYLLHLDVRAAGYFEDFKQGIKERWKMAGDFKPPTAEERRAFAIERQRQQAERKAEEKSRHEEAIKKAVYIWSRSTPVINHQYLVKKHVKTDGVRLYGDALVISIYDENKRLVNLQFINADGTKRFLSGGRKKGCFSVIGKPDASGIIQICEGWATGASLFEATGRLTVIALDAGNLEPVACVIRKLYPQSQIVICGDNDESGVGQKAARAAALACDGEYIIPPIVGQDFNDMLNSGVA
jgi:putative DNA primase/helicase